MRLILTLLFALVLWGNAKAATKTVIANNDVGSNKGWQNPNNWSPTGVPLSGDIVMVPAGQTITVKGSIYSTVAATLTINVYGTLSFDPSGTLNLSSSSLVQLFTATSKITSTGASSEQIVIGGNVKYNGQTDGTITGPAYTSYATSNSTSGTPGAGFSLGVLPIRLTRFTARAAAPSVQIEWTTALETGIRNFELQRSTDGKDWKHLSAITPRNTCNCATAYQYKDAEPETGTNYYRLLWRELDGSTQFSPVVTVHVADVAGKIVRYVLDAAGATLAVHLNAAALTFPVQVQLITANGQMVQNKATGASTVLLDVHNTAKGMALLLVKDAKGRTVVTKLLQ